MRALTRPLVVLTALAAVVATLQTENASAAKTVEVPVTMDWRIGYHGVATCASWGLATWPEQEGAIGWELLYHFSPPNPAYAGERSKRLSPPFDDELFERFGWTPGKGKHWDGLSYSGKSGISRPVSCGDLQARQKAFYSNVRIKITLEEDAKIVGTIKDTGGDPVQGVRVRARGAGADRTDADGEYEIDVPETKRTYTVVPKKGKNTFKPKQRKVRVNPGQTKRANFRMKVERQITGEVRMGCAAGSCGVLPVKGVTVRAGMVGKASAARSVRAVTDEKGRYKLRVKKGRYRVTTVNPAMIVTPARRTLNLTRKRKGTANFKACGLAGRGGASISAVQQGTWSTPRLCADRVDVVWIPSENRLGFRWRSVPTCRLAPGGHFFDARQARWIAGNETNYAQVDPGRGHRLILNDDKIDFGVPGPPQPPLFGGTIRSNGSGTVDGVVTTSEPTERASFTRECTYRLDNVALTRR